MKVTFEQFMAIIRKFDISFARAIEMRNIIFKLTCIEKYDNATNRQFTAKYYRISLKLISKLF